MLNSQSKWIEITPFGSSSSSSGGSGGNSGDVPGGDTPPVNDDIIYDGGAI